MAEFSMFMDKEHMMCFLQRMMPTQLLQDFRITACDIQHPRFKTYINPASRDKSFLALVYHLKGYNENTKIEGSRILYTKAFLASRSHAVFEKACQDSHLAGQENIFHLPEYGLVAWLFPSDPAMHWLSKLLSPEYLSPYFSQLLLASDRDKPSVVTRIETEIINYRPEIRCTCLHRIHHLSRRIYPVYSKTYGDRHGREVFRRMVYLFSRARQKPESFAIAKPLGYEEIYRTVWMEGLTGQPVKDVINTDNAEQLIDKLAFALADFHTAEPGGLASISEQDLLIEIGKKIGKLKKAFPDYEQRLHALNVWLEQGLAALPSAPITLIHGDFHIEQLLWLEDGRLALVDYDEMALGNPLLDIANFCTDLYNHPFDSALVSFICRHFFTAYQKFCAFDLNVTQFNWHLRIQLLTRAYRAYIQQKPGHETLIGNFIHAAETGFQSQPPE
jgi:Phosphotransferase enzyme family